MLRVARWCWFSAYSAYEASGDWRVLQEGLALGNVDLSDETIIYVTVDVGDPRFSYEMPNGNEAGVIPEEWVVGGKTKAGTTEAALVGSEQVVHNKTLQGFSSHFKNVKIIKE